MSSNPTLKAGAQVTSFAPKVFFSDVLAVNEKDGPLTPEDKNFLGNAYLNKHILGNPEFVKNLTPDDQQYYVSEFSKRYGLNLGAAPQIQNKQVLTEPLTKTGDFVDFIPGLFSGAAETGSYLTHPIEKLFNPNAQRYEATTRPEYKNNDAFRFGVDTGRTGSLLAEMLLGSRLLGPLGGTGAVSGNENLQRTLGGQQNTLQGIFNTALDTATAGVGNKFKTLVPRIAFDSAFNAGGAGIGYAGNQVLSGQPINIQDMAKAAAAGAGQGAIIGTAVNAGRVPVFPAKAQVQPQSRFSKAYQGIPGRSQVIGRYEVPGNRAQKKQTIINANKARALKLNQVEQSANAQSLQGEAKAYQMRLAQLEKIWNNASQMEAQAGDAYSKAQWASVKAKAQATYQQVLSEAQIKFPATAKPQKPVKAYLDPNIPEHNQRILSKVKEGFQSVLKGNEAKARFQESLKKEFDPETQRLINAKIKDVAEQYKGKQAEQQKKRIEQTKAEAQKQKELSKVPQTNKKNPPILDFEKTERLANELIAHAENGQKEVLNAKLSKIRAAAKKDYTAGKNPVSAEESKAINKSYQDVLQSFDDKLKALKEAKSPPPANRLKAKAQNLRELRDVNDQGGNYEEGAVQGKQKRVPLDAYTKEEVLDLIEERYGKDSAEYRNTDAIGTAMENDGQVSHGYEAERAGDTSTYGVKDKVAPLYFKTFNGPNGEPILGYVGINRYGHTANYYIEPSLPSKNGTRSMITGEVILHKESYGKAQRGTEPNIYFGQRSFDPEYIMKRPYRAEPVPTSETTAKIQNAQQAIEVITKAKSGAAIPVKEINAAQKVLKGNLKALKKGQKANKAEIQNSVEKLSDEQVLDELSDRETSRKVYEEMTGDPCK